MMSTNRDGTPLELRRRRSATMDFGGKIRGARGRRAEARGEEGLVTPDWQVSGWDLLKPCHLLAQLGRRSKIELS